ncbi:lipase secretion chaperone [Pseudomaricurvus sp.]|uniref:lipase secretion chaperone n=1 Tax=Pseudomaricurvus sp. TaxID=2004510 RepID=UPI003F6A6533
MKNLISLFVMFALLIVSALVNFHDFVGSVEADHIQISANEFYRERYYDGVFFDEIAPDATHTNFNSVSKSLSKLTFDRDLPSEGEGGVESLSSDELLDLLSAIARPMSDSDVDLPNQSVERLQFLLVKSLPGKRGETLSNLLPGYLCYNREKEILDEKFSKQKNNLSAQRKNYSEQIAVREACMGKVASDRLFQKSDKLTWYMFDRWEIMSDKSLTSEERKDRLDQLMNEFRPAVAQETRGEY